MKIKKQTAKLIGLTILIIIILWIVLTIVLKPSYPDIYTPKDVKGNVDAKIQIIEFSDLECPACSTAHPEIAKLVENYGDKVGLIFKHFPLNFHQYARNAAEAAECANDQGKFWEFVSLAYQNQKALSDSNLVNYAEQLNLNTKSFKACLLSDAKEEQVLEEYSDAINLGLKGTPTIIINGKVLENWLTLRLEIDSLLDNFEE
jgi:protein-disulfide isomerase